MSSRGRGFSSRGGSSYRGRGGGGSDWGSGGGGGSVSRGGYSSSRAGRFKYSTPSYDSRNKYASGGTSERYSSRGGRGDHSNSYKRQRDSYSTRDDHRSSSESNRKRIRSDSYQGGGSGGGGSQRYSSSYGGSSTSGQYDDNKRSSSSAAYEDKRQSDRASYHRGGGDDRHSASRNYAPPPPPPPRISDMAPPSGRYGATSRGGRISHGNTSFRGRITSRGGRGFHRVGSRTSDSMMNRKRTLTSLDYRRKMLGSRSRDYIQRVRMATTKLRRSGGTTRLTGSKKEPGTGSNVKDKDREMAKAINAEFSDDDKDEDVDSNWDEDEKPHEDDDEEVSTEKKVKEVKRKKEKQENAKIVSEEKEGDGKEDEEDEKPGDDEEAEEGDNAKGEGATGSDELPSRRDGRRFIKLNCPHCAHRSVTFKEYSLHLYSGRHNSAMRRIAARHKATLARMRVVQRQEQRRVEVRDASRGTLPSRTMFCPICKLNYRSLKAMHHLSESHRQMKRFLTPFCRVCRIQFRSPMLFETHVCSLDHIKRKSMVDERLNTGNGEAEADSSGPEEDDKEVNLDNFMTLDSVGDVDAEEEDEAATAASGEKKKKEKPDSTENTTATTTTTTSTTTIATTSTMSAAELEKKPKNKQMIKVGSEYIKRVEVQFCELCKVYLPRNESIERAVALHCSTRSHLKRYVRDNDDKALRRQAERIHLQTSSTTATTTTTATSSGAGTTSQTIATTTDVPKTEMTNNDDTTGPTSLNEIGGSTPPINSSVVNNGNNCQENDETVAIIETKINTSQEPIKDAKTSNDMKVVAAEEEEEEDEEQEEEEEEEEDEDEYRGDLGDKLWDDVDKDLGDILREAEPGAKSSDDEDSRYDRFRNSEKISQLSKEKEKKRAEGAKEAESHDNVGGISPKKIETKSGKVEKTDK